MPMPAELTRTSRPPCRSTCSATTPVAVLLLGDVRRDGERAELLGGGLHALGIARREREREALFGKHPRDRKADPSRSSGDERATGHGRILPHAYSGRMATGEVKLSELVTAGGCAAKYAAGRLEELLAGFVPPEAENLLVGLSPADDAAVYKLDDERALVFTVDFFPPVVDDPRDFGAIAAANALNDVFAMGGSPLLALSVAAFPEELPTSVLADVLAGADETVRAAGALLAGGHTIRDTEPKYGLAVVGTAHPDGVWAKSTAAPGDALFLTKPLGTGLVLHGMKRELAGEAELAEAVRWMRMLNRDAAEAVRPFAPNAVTDVTGFGLLGHAHETASRSGVRIVLDADACLRSQERSKWRARARSRAATAATGSSRATTWTLRKGSPRTSSRWRGIRRPRAACSSPCRRSAARCCRRRSTPPASSSLVSARSRRAPASSCAGRRLDRWPTSSASSPAPRSSGPSS